MLNGLHVMGNATSNMETNKQSSKSSGNYSKSRVNIHNTDSGSDMEVRRSKTGPHYKEHREINKISSNKTKARELGNVMICGNKDPEDNIQTENLDANNEEQDSNDVLGRGLAETGHHSKETTESPSISTNSNKKIHIISNKVVTIHELPRHSKPFKKRTLSVDASQELIKELTEPVVKKARQEPAQQTDQDTSTPAATLTSKEKVAPIRIKKDKAGPNSKYIIKNSNRTDSRSVAASPKEIRRSSTSDEMDDTFETLESICSQISEMNKHTQLLSNKFKELTTSLDENVTSSQKMYSLMDDLVALYNEGSNDSKFHCDTESDTSGSDEDDQGDDPSAVRPGLTSTSNQRDTDTQWTLKYQGKDFDTTELIPGSGIYVSRTGLVKCTNLAKTPPMLAKMLMTEIFTKQALIECSFSGICVKINGVARPPLDQNGAKALLQFVKQFSVENEWEVRNRATIRKNLTGFLSTFRKQYGQ